MMNIFMFLQCKPDPRNQKMGWFFVGWIPTKTHPPFILYSTIYDPKDVFQFPTFWPWVSGGGEICFRGEGLIFYPKWLVNISVILAIAYTYIYIYIYEYICIYSGLWKSPPIDRGYIVRHRITVTPSTSPQSTGFLKYPLIQQFAMV